MLIDGVGMRRRTANRLCECLARNMPRRLMHFTVLQAMSITSADDKFERIPRAHMHAVDVAEFVKPSDV